MMLTFVGAGGPDKHAALVQKEWAEYHALPESCKHIKTARTKVDFQVQVWMAPRRKIYRELPEDRTGGFLDNMFSELTLRFPDLDPNHEMQRLDESATSEDKNAFKDSLKLYKRV
jgi:hypothetical protein